MLCHPLREEAAIDPPRDIVPRRDGEEGARIVVEADGVVEPGRLGRHLAKPAHALRSVVEPPGGAEPQARVMPGQRRKLARIGAFIQREEDDREPGLVSEPVEQRTQRMDVVRPGRNVRALVPPEGVEQAPIVVAQAAGMDLHDQPVIHAHRRHFRQHLRPEQFRIFG